MSAVNANKSSTPSQQFATGYRIILFANLGIATYSNIILFAVVSQSFKHSSEAFSEYVIQSDSQTLIICSRLWLRYWAKILIIILQS